VYVEAVGVEVQVAHLAPAPVTIMVVETIKDPVGKTYSHVYVVTEVPNGVTRTDGVPQMKAVVPSEEVVV
jgi:predicted thioesterase